MAQGNGGTDGQGGGTGPRLVGGTDAAPADGGPRGGAEGDATAEAPGGGSRGAAGAGPRRAAGGRGGLGRGVLGLGGPGAAARAGTLEVERHDGTRVGLRLQRIGRGRDGPVLEGVCTASGVALAIPASAVRRLRHADGRDEEVSALVVRWMDRGWWRGRVDRLVILGVVAVAFWAAWEVQGPKNLGLYAVFWSGALWAAGGIMGWVVLRRVLGVDGWGR